MPGTTRLGALSPAGPTARELAAAPEIKPRAYVPAGQTRLPRAETAWQGLLERREESCCQDVRKEGETAGLGAQSALFHTSREANKAFPPPTPRLLLPHSQEPAALPKD